MQKPSGLESRWRSGLRRLRSLHLGVRSGSSGQGMVEYSLVLMLIAIVVIIILAVLGHRVSDMYSNISQGVG